MDEEKRNVRKKYSQAIEQRAMKAVDQLTLTHVPASSRIDKLAMLTMLPSALIFVKMCSCRWCRGKKSRLRKEHR